jgi:RNA polymerase sigma-70 factor (ECF subfamily)
MIPKLTQRPTPMHRSNRYAHHTDTQLILACQRNDQQAFACLISRHQASVYSLLHELMPEQYDNSDLAQEAFIRVWRSISTLRNPKAFRRWLRQIVTNIFHDELRQRGKQTVISMDAPLVFHDGEDKNACIQIADRSARPDEILEQRELGSAIYDALGKLPKDSRLMIVLRDCNGLSYREIGIAIDAPSGTVKSRIARARRKLQEKLIPFCQSESRDLRVRVLRRAS